MLIVRALSMCVKTKVKESPETADNQNKPAGHILIRDSVELVPVLEGQPFQLGGHEFTWTLSQGCLLIATVTQESDDAKAKAQAVQLALKRRQEYFKLEASEKQQVENLLTGSCARVTPEVRERVAVRRDWFNAAHERMVTYDRSTVETHYELNLPPNQPVENELFSAAVMWVPRAAPLPIAAQTCCRKRKERVQAPLLWGAFASKIFTMRQECTGITCHDSEIFLAHKNSVSSITKVGFPQKVELSKDVEIICLKSRGNSLVALNKAKPLGVFILPHDQEPLFVPLHFGVTLMATAGKWTVVAGDGSTLHIFGTKFEAPLISFDVGAANTVVSIAMNADSVFVLSTQGVVFTFSRSDGKRTGHFAAPFKNSCALSGICVDQDSVFVACANTVQQHTMEGELLMIYTSDFPDFIADFGCEDNRVYALDKANRVHVVE